MKYDFKIGSKCLLVHRKYCRSNLVGGRIIPVRVKTWENKKGIPEPVFTIIGSPKHELTLDYYVAFIDEQKAIAGPVSLA
jgi:hypothetical protein